MPDVEPADVVDYVVALTTQGDASAVAELVVPLVTAMAKSYTRGRGFALADEFDPFSELVPNAEIAAVITTASARLLANPEQIPYDSGSVSMRGGFNGWTLAELAVLNRYRVRAR